MFNSNIKKPISHVMAVSAFTTLMLCGVATQTALAETAVNKKDMVVVNSVDPDFKKLDIDKDHKVSLDEAAVDKVLALNFDVVDINKDRHISLDEHTSYKASLAAATTEGETVMPKRVN